MYYSETDKNAYFTVPCACSLNGDGSAGYCKSILGTKEYAKSLEPIKYV
jgi:hypothetical protein